MQPLDGSESLVIDCSHKSHRRPCPRRQVMT